MKIKVGRKYLTFGGQVVEIESSKCDGSVFCGVIHGGRYTIEQEWNHDGSIVGSIGFHKLSLRREIGSIEIMLKILFELIMMATPIITALLAVICLAAIAFKLIFN